MNKAIQTLLFTIYLFSFVAMIIGAREMHVSLIVAALISITYALSFTIITKLGGFPWSGN